MSTNKSSIDWYNENAEAYAAHVRDPKDSLYHSCYEKPAMRELIPDIKGKVVLSLGCGSGEDSQYLKNLGAKESIGVDISKGLIEIARKNHPDCKFEIMDMEKLSFPDRSLDFAYSSIAIHYIEYWDNVLKEVYRVLKPGGYFLFSCGHPIYSAMERTEDDHNKTKMLATHKDKTLNIETITGDYMRHRKIIGAGDDMKVTTWHKPIGEISSEISESGFLISNIVEPKPTLGMKKQAKINYDKLNKIPYFLIFKLLKPKKP